MLRAYFKERERLGQEVPIEVKDQMVAEMEELAKYKQAEPVIARLKAMIQELKLESPGIGTPEHQAMVDKALREYTNVQKALRDLGLEFDLTASTLADLRRQFDATDPCG